MELPWIKTKRYLRGFLVGFCIAFSVRVLMGVFLFGEFVDHSYLAKQIFTSILVSVILVIVFRKNKYFNPEME